MLSSREILLGIVLPLAVALAIGVIAWGKKQAWLLPLAVGLGFLLGYVSSFSRSGFGLPRLPPSDGSDWLFWTALPAIALAMLAAWLGWRWLAALLGLWAGVVVWAILRPLTPDALSSSMLLQMSAAAGVMGVIVVVVQGLVAHRIGQLWSVLSLCIALGGAGVTVMSSNLRTVGVYGLGAAAALAGVAIFAPRLKAAPAMALLAGSILCGLLAAGRYYPDPGVSWVGVGVLLGAPLVALAGLAVPAKHAWLRGLTALLAVAIAAAAVAAPAALAAMHAAQTDPYTGG